MPIGEEPPFDPEEGEQRTYTQPGIEKEEGSEARRAREIYENLVNRRLGKAVDIAAVPEEARERLMTALKEQAREIAFEQIRGEKDELTGLWRKEGLARQFEIELDYMETYKSDEVMVLIAVDLDRFKRINDTLGHEGADKVLKSFGLVIREAIRKTDLGGRPGGDEFVIVLTRVKKTDIDKTVNNLLENIRKIDVPELGNLTASLGVALIEKGEKPYFEDKREEADFATYVAKRNGRDRSVRSDSNEMQDVEKGEDWFFTMQKEKNGREIERYSIFSDLLEKFINLLAQQAKLDYELYLEEKKIKEKQS